MKRKKSVKKYQLLAMWLSFGMGLFLTVLIFSAVTLYHKIDKYLLEEKLGINSLIFADGTNEQEVRKFLKTIDPTYTQGLNYIVVIPNPIFSFLVNRGNKELYRGEAHGRFLKEERSIIFSDNGDFKDTFYHEVGHYIDLILFTNEQRKEWKNLMDLSIDYEKLSQFKLENNLSQQEAYKLDEYVKANYEHDLGEAFAIYFSLYVINESKIPHPEIRDYFRALSLNRVNCSESQKAQITIEEVKNA